MGCHFQSCSDFCNPEMNSHWNNIDFRQMVKDRVMFALKSSRFLIAGNISLRTSKGNDMQERNEIRLAYESIKAGITEST